MTDPPPVCVSHDVLQGPLAARHERPEHSPDARLGGLQEEEDQQTNSHTFVSTKSKTYLRTLKKTSL